MTRLAAISFAALVLGCSSDSDPIVDTGTPGAGVRTAITSIEPASGKYNVRFTITNRDTAGVDYPGCAGAVELATDSGWVRITGYRPCFFASYVLEPGASASLLIGQQQVDHGARIRVAFDWNFANNPYSSSRSASESVIVP